MKKSLLFGGKGRRKGRKVGGDVFITDNFLEYQK